jgi:hypothetical protein
LLPPCPAIGSKTENLKLKLIRHLYRHTC